MNTFALIGAAGYVAPKHMNAIKSVNGNLLAALDPRDSVGILDKYFPSSAFFTEFERFDRYIYKLNRNNQAPNYLSVCSPNYLHDAHIRFGLRSGMDVICEKPLVLNPWNLDGLEELEISHKKKVFNILQLRLHPAIINLKNSIENSLQDKKHEIDITYISARGRWYYSSWKADTSKSGGISTNIGIHFFDMLIWLFGKVQRNVVHTHTHDRAAGLLELEKARIRWFLSINAECLPAQIIANQGTTYRSIKVQGKEIEFSDGFSDLHELSYKEILSGKGYGIADARPSIELVHAIRNTSPIGMKGDYHPLIRLPLSPHPYSLDEQ